MSLPVAPKPALRRFHQARWDEPVIFELTTPGERGVLPSRVEPGVVETVGDVVAGLPDGLRRASAPKLPEMGQMRVLKHYLRLSQENLGADLNVDIGQGTCTMKYSPKVNEKFAGDPRVTDLHPHQDVDDVQGLLEIIWNTERMLAEIPSVHERLSLLTQWTCVPGPDVAGPAAPGTHNEIPGAWGLWFDLWAQAFRHDEVRAGRVELDARWRRMIVDAVESADLDVDARMFALEFSALLDGLSIQVALEDPEVDSKVAYDIAMRFAERELNLPADRKRAKAR